MRMFFYYATRTFKNQIRKLFRTWVAVFLLICVLGGALFGIGAAFISSKIEENGNSGTEETLPPDAETPGEGTAGGETPGDETPSPETVRAATELITGGIILVILVFSVLTADKSGNSIFLPADVNLLFPAPMKPQSVLMFRLVILSASSLILTVYLMFQLPGLMRRLGLGFGAALPLLGAWFFALVYSKLISVFLYIVTTRRQGAKKYLRPALYTLLACIAATYFATALRSGGDYFAAAVRFFNAPAGRYIPIWGWLKALAMSGMEGAALPGVLAFAALLAGAIILTLAIRGIHADFYEDAMARSAETAELQQAAQGDITFRTRKKDRSEKLTRDRFCHGRGASVYFFKTMYNRFRFAHFHLFTKTAETDLLIGVGVSLILLYVVGNPFFPFAALALSVFTFFRALGNPVADDVRRESFALVPDSAHKKLFFSFLGGLTNSALDLLPAFLVSAVLLRAAPGTVLLWYLLAVSAGAYADSTGVFIDLSLSTGLSRNIRAMVQLLFIYFGLAPAAALLAIGYAWGLLPLFTGITVVFCLGVTALFLALSPLFLLRGRR